MRAVRAWRQAHVFTVSSVLCSGTQDEASAQSVSHRGEAWQSQLQNCAKWSGAGGEAPGPLTVRLMRA